MVVLYIAAALFGVFAVRVAVDPATYRHPTPCYYQAGVCYGAPPPPRPR